MNQSLFWRFVYHLILIGVAGGGLSGCSTSYCLFERAAGFSPKIRTEEEFRAIDEIEYTIPELHIVTDDHNLKVQLINQAYYKTEKRDVHLREQGIGGFLIGVATVLGSSAWAISLGEDHPDFNTATTVAGLALVDSAISTFAFYYDFNTLEEKKFITTTVWEQSEKVVPATLLKRPVHELKVSNLPITLSIPQFQIQQTYSTDSNGGITVLVVYGVNS